MRGVAGRHKQYVDVVVRMQRDGNCVPLSVLWEDEETHGGTRYMIGHTDRYVRVAVKEGTEEYASARSGEITSVKPGGFLDDETLLA